MPRPDPVELFDTIQTLCDASRRPEGLDLLFDVLDEMLLGNKDLDAVRPYFTEATRRIGLELLPLSVYLSFLTITRPYRAWYLEERRVLAEEYAKRSTAAPGTAIPRVGMDFSHLRAAFEARLDQLEVYLERGDRKAANAQARNVIHDLQHIRTLAAPRVRYSLGTAPTTADVPTHDLVTEAFNLPLERNVSALIERAEDLRKRSEPVRSTSWDRLTKDED
jgi:hypothetical protein